MTPRETRRRLQRRKADEAELRDKCVPKQPPMPRLRRPEEGNEGKLTNRSDLDAAAAERLPLAMMLTSFVSLHPYFKIHAGKIEEFKAGFAAFVEKTKTEAKNLFYGFTINGDEVFCREGYADAEGLLAHLDNIGALLAEALKIADLVRLEVHGPAAELEKLRAPLAHLNPEWFVVVAEVGDDESKK